MQRSVGEDARVCVELRSFHGTCDTTVGYSWLAMDDFWSTCLGIVIVPHSLITLRRRWGPARCPHAELAHCVSL